MNPLQSRREFLVSTAATTVGLSLPSLPYLAKSNLVQDLITDPNEAFEQRFHQLTKISTEELRSNDPFKDLKGEIKLKAELVHFKTLGDLAFDPNIAMDQARIKFRTTYKLLSEVIKNNPLNLEEIFRNLQEQSEKEYYDRLRDLMEMSLGFNKFIPDNFTREQLHLFNKTHANFMKVLATKEDLSNLRAYDSLESFFKNTIKEIEANHRLTSRRELASRLATQAA